MGLSADSSTTSIAIYIGEFLLGLALVVMATLRPPRSMQPPKRTEALH